MRKILTLLVSMLVMAMAVLSPAQDTPPSPGWSLGAFFSITHKDYAIVASNKLRTIEDVANQRGLNLDLNAFAGQSALGRTIAGVSLTLEKQIAKDVFLFGGPGIEGNLSSGFGDFGVGFHVGIKTRFSF